MYEENWKCYVNFWSCIENANAHQNFHDVQLAFAQANTIFIICSNSCVLLLHYSAILGYTLNYLKIDCNLILAPAIEMRLLVRRTLYKIHIMHFIVFGGVGVWELGRQAGSQMDRWMDGGEYFKLFPNAKIICKRPVDHHQHTLRTDESKLDDLSSWHVTRFKPINPFVLFLSCIVDSNGANGARSGRFWNNKPSNPAKRIDIVQLNLN